MALIELKDVHRVYGDGETEVRALDGVSLSIKKGEIIALLGPSGSGKTTLLNIIASLDEPTIGEYHFMEEEVPRANVEKMTAFRRENIGYIFQFFNLLGDLTALENILLVQEMAQKRDRDLALSLLDEVGLSGLEDRFPAQMSGGQRQRVAIARSLSKSPKMILGDELTGNLDSKTSARVMNILIDACRDKGMTLLFVTHDVALTQFANRVIHLDSGKIISEESGGLDTVSGQAKTAVKEIKKGAKRIIGSLKGMAEDIIG